MKNVINFFLFIIYGTSIFFLPNNKFILLLPILNLFIILFNKLQIKKILYKNLQILPFASFTFIVNFILDSFSSALWIGLKLFIVCNITIVYSETTSIARYSRNNKKNMFST
jgi:hypothetical protein